MEWFVRCAWIWVKREKEKKPKNKNKNIIWRKNTKIRNQNHKMHIKWKWSERVRSRALQQFYILQFILHAIGSLSTAHGIYKWQDKQQRLRLEQFQVIYLMSNDACAVNGFRFDFFVAWQLVSFGSSHSGRQQFLAVLRNDAPVLGVHLSDGAELFAQLERFVQFAIVQLPQSFVRHEHFERVDASFLAQHLHFLLHRFRPPSHSDVQRIVATHFWIGPATPFVVRLEQRSTFIGQHKINWKPKMRSEQISIIRFAQLNY